MAKYRCVSGHDLCNTMLPSKDCPYCEKVTKLPKTDPISKNVDTSDIPEASVGRIPMKENSYWGMYPAQNPYPGGATQHDQIAENFRELCRLYQAANRLEEAADMHRHACWHETQADLLSAGMLAEYQR